MLNSGFIRTAFIISFTGHCLFLGMPAAINGLQNKNSQDITVKLEIDKPHLLPRVDVMGKEKKLKQAEKKEEQKQQELQSVSQIQEAVQPDSKPEEEIEVIDPKDEQMLRYQDMVKQKIQQARRYPLWAKKQHIEGTVSMSFVISPDRPARDIRILRYSGYSILDDEAVATIKRAESFPHMPKHRNNRSVRMDVAIVFALGR